MKRFLVVHRICFRRTFESGIKVSPSPSKSPPPQQEQRRCFSRREEEGSNDEGCHEGEMKGNKNKGQKMQILHTNEMDKFSFNPRSFTEITATSCKGLWSMMKSQDSFDAFLDRYRNNLIDMKELNIVEAMALQHELNAASPIFLRHNFNIVDFVDGAHLAVEAFLNARQDLEHELRHVKSSIVKKSDQQLPYFVEDLKPEDKEMLQKIVKHFLLNNDNSPPFSAKLQDMVTPSFFFQCCYGALVISSNNREQDHVAAEQDKTERIPARYKVIQATLLSVRTKQIALTNSSDQQLSSRIGLKLEDLFQAGIEGLNQIRPVHEKDLCLAQIDVLCRYTDIDESKGTEEERDDNVNTSIMSAPKEKQEPIFSEKNHSKHNVCTVTFLGWLHGGPFGSLAWKICDLKGTT